MKKYIIPFVAGILAISACQKEASVKVAEPSEITFSAVSSQTKTAFGAYDEDNEIYPTLWSGDETVTVSYNGDTGKDSETVEASEDHATANFMLSEKITADTEAEAHQFYALCPSSAWVGISQTKGIHFEIPTTQTPIDGSCDEAAQIIFSASESYESFPEHVDFEFVHVTAYGKISVTLPSVLDESKLAAITLTTPSDKPFSGRFYQPLDGSAITVSSAANSITLQTSSAKDVYFACAPVDLTGSTLKVVLTDTDGNTYTKTIDMTEYAKPLKFNAGTVSSFGVDMTNVAVDEVVTYTLVKDVNDLHAGDHIIIAASASDYAVSTTQNKNNRAQIAITKTDDVIKNPGDAVQIITLEQGTEVSNTAFFNVGDDNYLYADNSGNYLRTQSTKNAAASWAISIDEDGVATIVAQSATLRYLRYNSGNSIFSCYTSATSQNAVAIYSDGKGTEDLFVEVTPDTPEAVTLPYTVANSDLGSFFTIENITMPTGLTSVWSIATYNNENYYKGSAYASKTNYKAKSRIVSQEIDLTSETAAYLNFSFAVRYGTAENYSKVMYIQVIDGDNETSVAIPDLPTTLPSSWTYESKSVDLSSYCGKTIKVAFVYDSTEEEAAPTVELQGVSLTNTK